MEPAVPSSGLEGKGQRWNLNTIGKNRKAFLFICEAFQTGDLIYSQPCAFYKIQICFYYTKFHNEIHQPVSYIAALKIELYTFLYCANFYIH